MFNRNRSLVGLLGLLVLLTMPLIVAHGAGGRIEGKVTDPKGAAVMGASVTISEETTNQRFTALTDSQGHYKVEGLPAGVYTVVISATGFGESRKESVKVDEGVTVPVDLRLEIAAVEANVNVSAGAIKPNSDPVYQQLRQETRANQDSSGTSATNTPGKEGQPATVLADFAGSYAIVNNLVLKKRARRSRCAAERSISWPPCWGATPAESSSAMASLI